MKRIIIPLCMIILLVTSLALAKVTVVILSRSGDGSACTTPSTGDELNEGFLGTGYENTWTEVSTPDEDAALLGSPPTECCSEGLRCNGSETTAVYSEWDKGSVLSYPADIYLYLYFDTITIPTSYDLVRIVQLDDDTTVWNTGVFELSLKYDGTNIVWSCKGNTIVEFGPVSEDTWYKVKIHLDATAANSYIQVNDGTQHSFERYSVSGQYYRIGYIFDLDAGETVDMYCGYTYINTP